MDVWQYLISISFKLKTRHKLVYLGKIALLSICFRMTVTQNHNSGITLWYPPNINIWLVLWFWYPRVGSILNTIIDVGFLIIGPCIHLYTWNCFLGSSRLLCVTHSWLNDWVALNYTELLVFQFVAAAGLHCIGADRERLVDIHLRS